MASSHKYSFTVVNTYQKATLQHTFIVLCMGGKVCVKIIRIWIIILITPKQANGEDNDKDSLL